MSISHQLLDIPVTPQLMCTNTLEHTQIFASSRSFYILAHQKFMHNNNTKEKKRQNQEKKMCDDIFVRNLG